MNTNPFKRLERLLAPPPEVRGQVVAASGGLVLVNLPAGVQIRARGEAAVGDWVFVRDGVVTGTSPAMPGIDQAV